jgi:acylphosphatase
MAGKERGVRGKKNDDSRSDASDAAPRAPEKSGGDVKRLHVFFSGSVQGVGFRYTAATLASGYNITGWVRNLYDGRVELVAEGPVAEVEEYLEALRTEMGSYVQRLERDWETATGEFVRFSVAMSD